MNHSASSQVPEVPRQATPFLNIQQIFHENPRRSPVRDQARASELFANASQVSQDELGLLSHASPVRWPPWPYQSYSPSPRISFLEVMNRCMDKNRGSSQNPEDPTKQQNQAKCEFKPLIRLQNHRPDSQTDLLEGRINGSVVNIVNSTSNSVKDFPLERTLRRPSSHKPSDQLNSNMSECEGMQLEEFNSSQEPEIIKLKSLWEFLEDLFINMTPSEDHFAKLAPIDEQILNSLLQRKYGKRLPLNDPSITLEKKLDALHEIVNSKSQKRPEECYKFVLTRVIKYLKRKLRDADDCPPDVELYLYRHYFNDAADQLKIPITDFHYPLTGQRGKFKLNSCYFDKIFKSERFIEASNDYIENVLEDEYRSEINKKIESLLIRWDLKLQEGVADMNEIEASIKEYLIKNKRCKLPWTMKEVKESIERFKKLVKNYRGKRTESTD
jgi:hypothetical protein